MKKLQLHWQILIALLLAILYGIIFPTSYKIQEKSYKTMNRSKIEVGVIEKLAMIEDQEYGNLADFQNALAQLLSAEQVDEYEERIISSSYYNRPVSAISWLGVIFLRALKMIIIPLILSSLISGVTNIGSGGNLGRILSG